MTLSAEAIEDYGEGRKFVTSVETYCGHYLDFFDPRPEMIELEDIARGLSQVCRFASQTNRFFSVAEHAVHVRRLVIEDGHPELGFAALHHDSHEAYVGDWPSPLKLVFEQLAPGALRTITRGIDSTIAARFSIDPDLFRHPVIKRLDLVAMRREAATLKYSHGVGPHWGFEEPMMSLAGVGWSHDRAEREFLSAHAEEMSA